jgi:hypothetical protein
MSPVEKAGYSSGTLDVRLSLAGEAAVDQLKIQSEQGQSTAIRLILQ